MANIRIGKRFINSRIFNILILALILFIRAIEFGTISIDFAGLGKYSISSFKTKKKCYI
jgi:hypothetical protein